MPTLTIREPGRVAVKVSIAGGVTLGRDPTCEIVLRHRSVSRRHARVEPRPEGVTIVDLGSTHGTLVEGQKIAEHLLRHGDAIHLGTVLLEYGDRDEVRDLEEITVHPTAPPSMVRGGGADAQRLAILYEIGRAIGAHDEPEELVGRILAAALEAFGCERGVVELSSGSASRRVTRGVDDMVVSRSIVEALLSRRERVLVTGRIGTIVPTLLSQGVRAAMGVPLLSARGVIGFIYVDDRTRHDRFTVAELDFLTAVAHLLAAALEQARERRRLESVVQAERQVAPVELVGDSEPMRRLRLETARYASARDTPVLIRGESGSGKELVARTLHVLSPRAGGPFVAVNCAAIPDTLIESELFGHARGAFTGAIKAVRGKLALADGGTLFLDEVGDLSPAAQAKLLRALEDGEVQPLGAERPVEIDVRVVAATHKALDVEIAAGRFRDDLFYRLAVGEILVPPLRQRGDDVLALAELFRVRYAAKLGKRITGFAPEAAEALRRCPWPGNVRQLKNEIERAVILADGSVIAALAVGAVPSPPAPAPAAPAGATFDAAERALIENALRSHRGNVLATARAIGVSRGLLYRKIAKYDIKL